ncbi:MAG: response regulator transcription factor [Clostridia bacterium]|nr:response regulator transcription factor [Clostridia bacterium]
MKLLIIEDEKKLASALSTLLQAENYLVDMSYDGISGLDMALTDLYDLILLDIMLPKMDGLAVLKALRNEKINTPVILLTARNQLEDRVKGLNIGADDYLTKPFAFEELLARIKAQFRRHLHITTDDVLNFGDLNFNINTLDLFRKDKSVKLTLKESEIMQLFMMRGKMITPKELIIERLWGYDSDVEDNNVEVYISFLRKKLKYLNSDTQIKTTRGVGYALEV